MSIGCHSNGNSGLRERMADNPLVTLSLVRSFIALAPRDRRLVSWTAVLLLGIRLALSFLSFGVVLNGLRRVSRASFFAHAAAPASIERALWAVEVCSNRLPPARTCLIRALAAQTLLVSAQNAARFRIGVAKDRDGTLQAHAWVESNGRVVIGASADVFVPLQSRGKQCFDLGLDEL